MNEYSCEVDLNFSSWIEGEKELMESTLIRNGLRYVTLSVVFIVNALFLRSEYSLSVSNGYNSALLLYAANLIGMSQCDGFECFCSSCWINVYDFSSAFICCFESDITVLFVNHLLGITRLLASVIEDLLRLAPKTCYI